VLKRVQQDLRPDLVKLVGKGRLLRLFPEIGELRHDHRRQHPQQQHDQQDFHQREPKVAPPAVLRPSLALGLKH
jgi:hypothetical protein